MAVWLQRNLLENHKQLKVHKFINQFMNQFINQFINQFKRVFTTKEEKLPESSQSAEFHGSIL
ncbi:hypothetical protein AN396_01580 [Candidatus Epulonipiscium fishelsonii]|uniref:Uncharacterized protein n=1 Tax=Candidatus Epulonipiscium fishelsonii TaxID=77094 RepID=A0ACC8X860_9FIRM|nr:hypothetical protein AN396_01580 [Epulopiscium sp. SCG-B11WGA-EpuloA1]